NLERLNGLEGIDPTGITTLRIQDNFRLRTCSVESICRHLRNGGLQTISGNAQGCNSGSEVLTACVLNHLQEADPASPWQLYPNPTTDAFQIIGTLPENGAELRIYNSRGRLLQSHRLETGNQQWSLATVPAGVYFVQVRDPERPEWAWMEKMVKR
ncbi:MAG: T9SS type A sorting domain-containing protein, partial [Bacteroidota bacterium]